MLERTEVKHRARSEVTRNAARIARPSRAELLKRLPVAGMPSFSTVTKLRTTASAAEYTRAWDEHRASAHESAADREVSR